MSLQVEHRSLDAEAPMTNTSRTSRRLRSSWANSPLTPGWPIVTALVGLPLWWVLGLTQLIFFLMAVPMAIYLLRLRVIATPRSFGIWLLLLVWMLAGLFVLQVDAPGAVPGGSSSRYLTFAYRGGWYVVATIAMLYVINTRHVFSTSRVSGALSYAFLIFIAGGYLGILLPSLEFPSLLELALPNNLRSNQFVADLVHAQSAQVQDFLGYANARPSAPFTYTNEWGLNIALTLPFFVAEWWRRGGRWRVAMPVLLVVAAVPLIDSLNRGLWGAIIVMAAFYGVRTAMGGKVRVLIAMVVLGTVAFLAIAASPLGERIGDRLANPHSNEGRGNLGLLSVQSTIEGSPVIGFGTTRDVPGNFNSIAGGDTANCPRCSPPPLGTQGQLWLLIFGAGFGGFMLYSAFFATQFLRHIRDHSPHSMAALCSIVALFVTMPVYNSVHAGLFIALVAMGVLARAEPDLGRNELRRYFGPTWRNANFLVAMILLGAAGGAITQRVLGTPASATQSVLVPASDLTGVEGARSLTLDSEALIARSQPVVEAIMTATDEPMQHVVEEHLVLSAASNSRILRITYTDADPVVAAMGTEAAVQEYLNQRQTLIEEAGTSLTERLEERQEDLDRAYAEALASLDEVGGGSERLEDTLAQIQVQSQATVSSLGASDDESSSPGRTLSPVRVVQTNDGWIIRVGSGIALGTAAGLVLIPLVDRRRRQLGDRPQGRMYRRGLPTVARISRAALDSNPEQALLGARRAMSAYVPLASVLADPESGVSIRVANLLENGLPATTDFSGQRALLVAEAQSRFQSTLELAAYCHRVGLQPVGVVIIR